MIDIYQTTDTTTDNLETMIRGMSHVDGERSLNPYVHFKSGMKDFFRIDNVRLVNILGSIQYGLLYAIVFFFGGIFIETLFPKYSPTAAFRTLALQVLLQCIVLTILIFYARKFIESIPGLMTFFPNKVNEEKLIEHGLVPYTLDEYKGETMMSIILVGVSINLLRKIGRLAVLGEKKYF